jgi:hypothetical protein
LKTASGGLLAQCGERRVTEITRRSYAAITAPSSKMAGAFSDEERWHLLMPPPSIRCAARVAEPLAAPGSSSTIAGLG